MKQERTLIRFECDECAKRTEESEQPTRLPYEDGWMYLYRLCFKTSKHKENDSKDKHFCCKDCMIKWLNDKIESKIIQEKKE
jgi:hypothetical protein